MKISELYNLINNRQISTDTRNIKANSVFFALKGDSFNGNTFAEQALNNGADYAIIDEKEYLQNEKCILVDDVLKTLQDLANYHRKQFKIPVIAITGTNGKTTTKELTNIVLSKKFKTIATEGNLNNHIGVPLTLLNIKSETEIAIIEIGANHPNEIAFLCEIAEPEFGIITNIGKAHLEGFGSYEGVIKTKNELYQYIKKKGNLAFVNEDDLLLNNLSKDINRQLYKTISNKVISIDSNQPFLNLKYANSIINTKIAGKYNFDNIIAAYTIGKYFGVSDNEIASALEEYTPKNNRSQITNTAKNAIIMDAYNANPSSMNAAFENFLTINHSKKIAILGDMFELGNDSIDEHKAVIEKFISDTSTHTFFIGKDFLKASTDFTTCSAFEDISSFRNYIVENPILDSLILLKGSRGMKMEQLLEIL
ncbi:MAG: UDP-N-acetylmuramoyl-tripeptide--D-alanyl-D-alanine ligase [Bacteroidota bacterium]